MSVKSSTELMLYVVLTMPTLNKAYLFIYLFIAFNAEVLLGVVNHGLMISFITLTCTDVQQLNKQYDHNDFQVDVPDSIGVSKIYLSMYV